jgi:hypothetical protein
LAKYEPDWEEIIAQKPVEKSEPIVQKEIEVTENKAIDDSKMDDNVEKAPKRKPIVFDLVFDPHAEVNPIDLLIGVNKHVERKKVANNPAVVQKKVVEGPQESIPDDDDLIILDQTEEEIDDVEVVEASTPSKSSIFQRLGGKAMDAPKPETDLRKTLSAKKNPAFPDTMAMKYNQTVGNASNPGSNRRRSSPGRARSRTRSPMRTRNRRRSSHSSRSSSGSRSPRRDRRRRRSSGRKFRRSRSRSTSRTRDSNRRGR